MNENLKDLDNISGILSMKRKILKDIHDLTYEQNRKIKDDDIDGFIKIIDRKQIRMDKIDSHDKKLKIFMDNLKVKKNTLDTEDLNNDNTDYIDQLKNEIQKILKNIYNLDIENNIMYNAKLNEVRKKALGVRKGKKLTSTYYPKQMEAQGYFIDKKR